jgi:hypothetical protein
LWRCNQMEGNACWLPFIYNNMICHTLNTSYLWV